MLPKFPNRAVLLAPVLGLGLLVPGLSTSLTSADALPVPCGEVAAAAPAGTAADDMLVLKSMLPDQATASLAAAPPEAAPAEAAPAAQRRGGPMAPELPVPPRAPRSGSASDALVPTNIRLRAPNPALLNMEPIVAARQLRESLSPQQKATLQAVLTKYQGALQQARPSVPELAAGTSAGRSAGRSAEASRGTEASQVSPAVQGISTQIDQEIASILTPAQQELLRKARPNLPGMVPPSGGERHRSSGVLPSEETPGC